MEFFMGHFGKALLTGASILAVGILVVTFLKSETANSLLTNVVTDFVGSMQNIGS